MQQLGLELVGASQNFGIDGVLSQPRALDREPQLGAGDRQGPLVLRRELRRAGARKDLQTADAGAAHGDRQHADAARAIASVAMRSNDADPS